MQEYYMVFRVNPEKDRPTYIGWTTDRNILKAFFCQRDERKYRIREQEIIDDELKDNSLMDDCWELHLQMYRSNHTDEMVPLVTTDLEILESVQSICEIFDSYSSGHFEMIYSILEREYRDALHIIGYHPEYRDDTHDETFGLDGAGMVELYQRLESKGSARDEIFSLESFIKVMESNM